MDLITGATGLLGSHIAEQLVNQRRPVRALVRPNSDTRFLESLGVELAPGDVTDPAGLRAAFAGVRTVYHAAARVGDWGPWESFVAVTIEGTRNMLDAARDAKAKRFLHVSSISAYGHPDGEGLVLDESAPLGAGLYKWSYYSRSKVAAENLAWEYHNRGDVPVTVVKPSWLYGLRDRASMPRLVKRIAAGKGKLLGDGTNRLNLTNAANEAQGCILAATADKALGQNYNLAADGVITQAEYFNAIARVLNAPPVTRKVPYKVAYRTAHLMEIWGHLTGKKTPPLVTRYAVWLIGRRCFFSSQKARTELGWQPTIGYEEGVEQAVRWCMEHSDA